MTAIVTEAVLFIRSLNRPISGFTVSGCMKKERERERGGKPTNERANKQSSAAYLGSALPLIARVEADVHPKAVPHDDRPMDR